MCCSRSLARENVRTMEYIKVTYSCMTDNNVQKTHNWHLIETCLLWHLNNERETNKASTKSL